MTLPQGIRERGVLVDSSAMFAAMDRRDQWHRRAVEAFSRLRLERRQAHMTNLAMAETHGLIASRMGPVVASRWLDGLTGMQVLYHTQEDHDEVIHILRAFPLADFSYADAFSFLTMERLGIRKALTFDHHFAVYGWELF